MTRARTMIQPTIPPLSGGLLLPTHDSSGRPLVRLQTLGATTLLVGDARISSSAGTLFALLLRLAGTPGMQLRRDALLLSLWPDLSDVRQRANLRQASYKLRRTYGVRVSLHGDVVHLDSEQIVRTFSVERSPELFERDVVHGNEPFGVYLPGVVVPWPEMQEWIDEQRETVHADVRRVLSEQLRARRDRADWSGANSFARWLRQFDPLNEEATLTIAECTALSGSKQDALAILDRYLSELGPHAGDIRLQATMLRRRIAEPSNRGRISFAPTERHFVGREEDLAALSLSMRRARWHDGSAVLVHGPAGMGKTRLASELEKVAMIEGIRVVQTECRESDLTRSMSVFFDIVPELLQLPGALGCAPESMAALKRFVPGESAETEDQGDDGPVEKLTSEILTGEVLMRPAPLRRAILDLLAAVSDEKSMLVIVDDVHWIDDHSWDVLVDLIDCLSSMRVFLLMLSREPHARLNRPERVPTALTLRPLVPMSPESCLALSQAIADDLAATATPELGTWFVAACEGSPLYLRALVNHWIETGEAGGLPPTLRGVIEQRLSRLSSDSLLVLQTASLMERWATIERVGRALELRTAETLYCIEQLEKNSTLSRLETRKVAVHDLVAKAARDKLSPLSASTLHRSTAAILESEGRSASDSALVLEALSHAEKARDNDTYLEFVVKNCELIMGCDTPAVGLQAFRAALSMQPSAEIRILLSRAEARLQHAAGEYSKAATDPVFGDVVPGLTKSLNSDDVENALTALDSAYRANVFVDRDEIADYMIGTAQLEHLRTSTRLRAAEIGLVILANQADGARSARLFEAVAHLPIPDEHTRLFRRVALLFHTTYGDRNFARTIALQMYSDASQARPSTQAYQDAIRAGFALRLVDNGPIHFEVLNLAFDLAERLEMPAHALNAAYMVAMSHLHNGDVQGFEQWVDVAEARHEKLDEPVASNFVFALLCIREIHRSRVEAAREYLQIFQSNAPRMPALKASTYSLTLEVAIELMDNSWIPSEPILATLVERHSRVANSGVADYCTSVVIESLVRAEQPDRAVETFRKYREVQRREIAPISDRLASTLRRLHICASL